jgi:AcrR family transcriptional regulator
MSTDRKTRAEAAQVTADRLIAVAQRAFAEKGFAEVSLDALAADAGMTRGAVHHHFGNKAGLFKAVLQQMDAEVGEELTAGWDPALPSWTAWRACFHQYLDAVQRPDRLKLFFCEGPAVLGADAFDLMLTSGLAEIIEGLDNPEVRAALTTRDAEALAHTLNGAVVNLAFWIAEAPDSPDRLPRAHAILRSLFDGLTDKDFGTPPDASNGP